jgi:hypothetical protein
VDGKDKPVFMKAELESQMPMLKKQNLLNVDYAKKDITGLFAADRLSQAVVKLVNYSTSCIAVNNGAGNFSVQPLPASIQFSSISAIRVTDVNGDGINDLVMAGNEFGFQPQLGRLDAGDGDVLINDGKAHFVVLTGQQSGIDLPGQTREILQVIRHKKNCLLFLQNNELPVLYELNAGDIEKKTDKAVTR